MSRIKKELIFGILIAITLIMIISLGCGEKDTRQKCDLDSDCPVATGLCKQSLCEEGFCTSSSTSNCCGNTKCESGENSCTCEKDCKKCNGSIMIKTSTSKLVPANYLKKACNDVRECVPLFDDTLQKENEQFNELTNSAFRFNIITRYPTPFDKPNSQFDIEAEIKYLDLEKVQPPIIIKRIRVMEGSTIIASTDTYLAFGFVGDKGSEKLDMSYTLTQPEETKSLTINIEYEYVPLRKVAGGYEPDMAKLETYKYAITQKLTILDVSLTQ